MKNGKFAKRGVATKAMVMILAVMLIVGVSVGGTLAWLTAKTGTVENTFTVGDINITLTETWNTDTDGNNTLDAWTAMLIPGTEYEKDPVVTVSANSEDCYLFVKFEEINNPKTYLTYTSLLPAEDQEDGWKKLPDQTDVWYREVAKTDTTRSWHLLADNKVSVKTTVVKPGTIAEGTVAMPAAENAPALKYTAYAVQMANLTVADAWAQVAN